MRPIRVVNYDPRWPDLFEAAKAELMAAAGNHFLTIEHIGSTSVPGLAAKPKIDLDAVLVTENRLAELGLLLRAAGYVSYGDPHGEGRWPFTRDHDGYGLRLYLCASGNSAHRERLLFRDYLRRHAERAAEYQALKQRLAVAADGDWDAYTGGKSDFVRETLRRAMAETGAAATG